MQYIMETKKKEAEIDVSPLFELLDAPRMGDAKRRFAVDTLKSIRNATEVTPDVEVLIDLFVSFYKVVSTKGNVKGVRELSKLLLPAALSPATSLLFAKFLKAFMDSLASVNCLKHVEDMIQLTQVSMELTPMESTKEALDLLRQLATTLEENRPEAVSSAFDAAPEADSSQAPAGATPTTATATAPPSAPAPAPAPASPSDPTPFTQDPNAIELEPVPAKPDAGNEAASKASNWHILQKCKTMTVPADSMVYDMYFDPLTQELVSTSRDGILRVWSQDKNTPRASIQCESEGFISCLEASGDHQCLYGIRTARKLNCGLVALRRCENGWRFEDDIRQGSTPTALKVLERENKVTVASSWKNPEDVHAISVFDPNDLSTPIEQFQYHSSFITRLEKGFRDSELVSAGMDGKIVLWDIRRPHGICGVIDVGESLACTDLDYKDGWLAGSFSDKMVRYWDPRHLRDKGKPLKAVATGSNASRIRFGPKPDILFGSTPQGCFTLTADDGTVSPFGELSTKYRGLMWTRNMASLVFIGGAGCIDIYSV
eukprot:Rmarinus@m.22582